jgi:DeoR family transcriptional regulator, aga operon transcriptional repressor
VRRAERISGVLDHLAEHGSLSVLELADRYQVSQATIRRDLQVLEEQRLLARTHGGALAENVAYELPLRYRDGQARDAKRLIAREAARRIPSGGSVIALTGGTTTTEVAKCIADRSDITVVTNALNIAAHLAVRPRTKVIVTGGVARAQSYELVGPMAERTLQGLNIEVAFVGVDGISASGGLSTHDEVEAHTNEVLVGQARRVIVVCDGSKVGRIMLARIAPITSADALITSRSADPDALAAIVQAGVEVHVVDAD